MSTETNKLRDFLEDEGFEDEILNHLVKELKSMDNLKSCSYEKRTKLFDKEMLIQNNIYDIDDFDDEDDLDEAIELDKSMFQDLVFTFDEEQQDIFEFFNAIGVVDSIAKDLVLKYQSQDNFLKDKWGNIENFVNSIENEELSDLLRNTSLKFIKEERRNR